MTGDNDNNGQNQDPMTNKTSPGGQPSNQESSPEPSTASTEPDITSDDKTEAGTSPGDATPLDEARKETAVLSAQLEELKSKLQLAYADIQNLHKRFERERSDIAKYSISKFAEDIVGVADNFERAITSVPEGAASENAVFQSLLDGVTMTEREFLNVLERHGVKRVNPEGEIFDPHHHQAMMEQDDPSVPQGTILQVYQQAYLIEDRVLRPAMVVVAKGGPKLAKAEEKTPQEPPPPPPKAAAADDEKATVSSNDAAAPPDGTPPSQQDASAGDKADSTRNTNTGKSD